ncbi:MAG: amidohydrolase family protein [Clostridiales bacterium]|nr:amidohydrolase family protein [Clostridiales bacterium]
MIIDFHTHVFPDAIAGRTIKKLAECAGAKPYTDGTKDGLRASMKRAGVDRSINLPVVTRAGQEPTVNRTAIETNSLAEETGLLSFGGIHPDTTNYREILRDLAANGIRGIKIHPVYQGVPIDDIRFLRIIECACEYGLIVETHSGYDIGFPGQSQVLPQRVRRVIDEIHPDRLVLAHTGGWGCWDEVEELLVGQKVYFDLSFSLTAVYRNDAPDSLRDGTPRLSREQFVRIVRRHGADRILLGSDSPWSDQAETIRAVRESGLTDEEIARILGENAERLLGME